MSKPDVSAGKSTLLQHIGQIIEAAEKNGLDNGFFVRARADLEQVSARLNISPLQAALFSLFVDQSEDTCISPGDIARSAKWKTIKVLQNMGEFDELARKKLIVLTKDSEGSKRFRVPPAVLNALIKNTPIEILAKGTSNLDIFQFFDALETLVDMRHGNETSSGDFIFETNNLLEDNKHLKFSQAVKGYRLKENLQAILLFFCERLVNNDDDEISFSQIADIFESASEFRRIRDSFRSRDNALSEKGIIENTTSEGFGSQECFKISDTAKGELFSEINICSIAADSKKDLIPSSSIVGKKMFYNPGEGQKVGRLIDLLKPQNYQAVLARFSQRGMRGGFACLFHGSPGTGKTETVNLVAKETGRDIMRVDIAKTKSCWFGESEKLIKNIFDKYRAHVEKSEAAPILLFNEADAVIGKRKSVSAGSVAQTENTIQNIILQELENLKGILIATTNLTQNIDRAFERRFLFKIEFEKPSLEARKSIWRLQIPELPDDEAAALAEKFDFTGGQIENVARKYIIDSVLSGDKISLGALISHCRDESLRENDTQAIGFQL
jgi:SpoVK/Ycf46/Vps4 family AAA+-type ATPase